MKVVALRRRPAGGGVKPPHAALAEDRRGVNGTPKLTPWRHPKSDPLGGLVDLCWIFWFWCPGRRGGSGMVVSVLAGGGRNAPQIAVFKPVAVPFKRENLRVMD